MFLEIELKLHIEPADATLLHDHPFILEHMQTEPETHYLISTYYDTINFDLRKKDFSLRIRECEQRFYQTLKSAGETIGNLHHRHEWETETKTAEPDLTLLTPDIQASINPIINNKILRPIFKTEFQRTTWQLTLADQTRVELALDFGKVYTAESEEQISEIELELKAGDSVKLSEIADVLSKSIPLTIENRSKAARGYQLCSKIPLSSN